MFDASKLTDEEFSAVLQEFRNRGYAIAVYGVAELGEGPLQDDNGDYDEDAIEAWLEDRREEIEDAMCDRVWEYCRAEPLP